MEFLVMKTHSFISKVHNYRGGLTDISAETKALLLMQVNSKEELRCVLAIIRHGDRTPKQKIKLKVRDRQ